MAAAPGVRRSELGEALRACRSAFIGVGVMSCMINLLYLTGSIFMLEVYDRVLPSRSVPTLVGLVILAAGLFTALGLLDMIRGRILVRIGGKLDEALSARVYETNERLPQKAGNRGDSHGADGQEREEAPHRASLPRTEASSSRSRRASRHRRDAPPGCRAATASAPPGT